MASVMITGAQGLIGHALRVALEEAGRSVIATDLVAGTDSRHPVETVDVLDRDGVQRVVAENEVAAIVHCGGASGPMVRPDDPLHVWTVNMTIGEVALVIREVYPDADIEVGDGVDPQDEVQARFDISAAARDLGYRPKVSLLQGIHAYGAWLAQGMHRDAEAGGDMP